MLWTQLPRPPFTVLCPDPHAPGGATSAAPPGRCDWCPASALRTNDVRNTPPAGESGRDETLLSRGEICAISRLRTIDWPVDM